MILHTLARLASPERAVRAVLEACDVRVGGARTDARPWDLRVHDRAFYWRMALNPSFELGETYLDGLWDCDAIDELVFRFAKGGFTERADGTRHAIRSALARLVNRQSRARATQVTDAHYDLGVDVYEATLDRTLTYTCAIWADGDDLEAAQRRKLRAICEKLDLRPGQRLLDIGCGFGALAIHAAEEHGVEVLAISNSKDHVRVARERARHLPGVEVALLDYRELATVGRRFDAVASIEMIEAVGPKNYDRYMELVRGCLAPDGAFLLQCFLSPWSVQRCNEWFDRHVFPNGVSPSMEQLDAAAGPRLGPPVRTDDLGRHYAPTLLAWDRNFAASWPALRGRYPERFRRLWHFYLTCLAGVFRAGDLGLVQLVYGVRRPSPPRPTAPAGATTRRTPGPAAGRPAARA